MIICLITVVFKCISVFSKKYTHIYVRISSASMLGLAGCSPLALCRVFSSLYPAGDEDGEEDEGEKGDAQSVVWFA